MTGGGNSGIISEKSSKSLTLITDKTIDRVPLIQVSGYSSEQNSFIQNQHKELLSYSREKNENKEVAFVFDSNFNNRKEFLGGDDNLDFGVDLQGKDLFIMHNHPRNSSYSDTDIAFFISNDNVKSLSIVKNSGAVEILTKTSKCDKKISINNFKRQYKNYVKTGSNNEIDNAVNAFIKKNKEMISWNKSQ